MPSGNCLPGPGREPFLRFSVAGHLRSLPDRYWNALAPSLVTRASKSLPPIAQNGPRCRVTESIFMRCRGMRKVNVLCRRHHDQRATHVVKKRCGSKITTEFSDLIATRTSVRNPKLVDRSVNC